MKKLVLLLAAAALATAPAMAATKHKKSKEALEAESIAQQHDNTKRLLVDLVPLVLPSWSLPVYFGMHLDEKKPEKKKMKK
jgi:hypothetical protein